MVPAKGQEIPNGSGRFRAFSLVELLAVLATIAVLAALLLPALSDGRVKAQRLTCLHHLKQLTVSWQLFADEHDGRLVSSYPWLGLPPSPVNSNAWVFGDMADRFTPYQPGVLDSTNINTIRDGQLFAYNRSTTLYRCPADESNVNGVRRVRSYSMNNYMGGIALQKDYRVFHRESEIVNPPPSAAWVLIDENENSINDGWFAVDMDARRWIDLPATRHQHSFVISFADSHAEIWRLSDEAAITNQLSSFDTDNRDLLRLRNASTSSR